MAASLLPVHMGEKSSPPLADESEKLLPAARGITAPPIIRPMQYKDVPNAAKNGYDAILNDPVTIYLNSVDTAPGLEWRHKLAHALSLADHVNRNAAVTIAGGDALLTLGYPGNRSGWLFPRLGPLLKVFDTEELTKRKQEFVAKMEVLYKNAFGDSREDMIEVEGLATAPAQQGKGYGTLMMLFVNAMADVQKRGVYLVTSNTHEFYQRFGYSIVQQDVLGVDNPEWKGDPVPLRIMYRKPRSFPIMAEDDKTSLP